MSSHKIINDSFKSILSVTIPILLTTLSSNLMYITDRFMLAGYSINAMNAAVIGGNFVAVFTFMFIGVANTAEVYVGQYNGAKQYGKMANATWQMIYLSILSIFLFFPLAYFTKELNTFPEYLFQDGISYQKPLLYFGFLPVLISALSTFFIGQGKTKIITFIVVFGSFLNAILDYLFIYKANMGCKGAAFATIISEILQIAVLVIVFFSKNNRTIYKTIKNYYFNNKVFKSCIKIGIPLALGNCISILAWYLIQLAFAYTSRDLSTIYNFGINIYILFIFIGEGLNKAIAAISANMMGQNNLIGIKKTYKRFIIIALVFGALTAIPLLIFPEKMLGIIDMLHEDISPLYSEIKASLRWLTFGLIFEAMTYITWGILLSGGDTRYPMLVTQICLWGLIVIPTGILFYYKMLSSPAMIFGLISLWCLSTFLLIYKRYKSLKWYNRFV